MDYFDDDDNFAQPSSQGQAHSRYTRIMGSKSVFNPLTYDNTLLRCLGTWLLSTATLGLYPTLVFPQVEKVWDRRPSWARDEDTQPTSPIVRGALFVIKTLIRFLGNLPFGILTGFFEHRGARRFQEPDNRDYINRLDEELLEMSWDDKPGQGPGVQPRSTMQMPEAGQDPSSVTPAFKAGRLLNDESDDDCPFSLDNPDDDSKYKL